MNYNFSIDSAPENLEFFWNKRLGYLTTVLIFKQ